MGTLFLHAFVGTSLLAITAIFYFFPPATINSWYGYRTPRSMRSPQAWQRAQKIANRGLLRVSLVNLLVHLVSAWFIPTPASVLVPLGTFLAGVALTVVLTERQLKHAFPH